MTGRANHVFDTILKRQGIIGCRDVSCAHAWIEQYLVLCSWQAREAKLDLLEVKDWIIGMCNQENPELLTDYLRVALGHIVLSSLLAGFRFENEYECMKYAYQTYLDRGYQCCSVETGEGLLTHKTFVSDKQA